MSDQTIRKEVRSIPIRSLVVRVLSGPSSGQEVEASLGTMSIGASRDNDLVLNDETVSRYHAEVKTAGSEIEVTDLGSTNGTFANGVRVLKAAVASGTELVLGQSKLLVLGSTASERELPTNVGVHGLRGRSPAMRTLIAEIEKMGRSNASVLIVGETGAGKEAVAEALHAASLRAEGPFEIVDCGVLAPTLVASELFGHERGAFTGAESRRTGAFERANGGTLLLDEVGELPLSLQASLLGVLERRSFKRLGGDTTIQADVRVVAATHRDLRSEVNAGRFRQDLYYRIAAVRLRVPSLRERPDDLPILIEHFLREAGHSGPVEAVVPPSVMQQLIGHQWPGNVRELRNFVDAALALGGEAAMGSVDPDDAGRPSSVGRVENRPLEDDSQVSPQRAKSYRGIKFRDAREAALREFEYHFLTQLLEQTNGNISQAARISDVHRSYLNILLKRHQLRRTRT